MVLKRNPDIIPDLGSGENYRVLKHGPNLLKRLCSLGGGRNYRVLKLHMVLEDVITSLTSKNQHLDFNVLRLWRRVNYRILKPHRRRHWFGRERNYMVLKPGRWTTGLEEDKIT